MKRFLIVRTDRLGDVLLTTPVSTALRRQFPEAKISWLVRPYTAPVLENNPDVDEILVDQGRSVEELTKILKAGEFSAAIVAYPRWRTVWAAWRAGIPQRVGPANKWYAVFLNQRIHQHRSRGERHEADYNLELLRPLGVPEKRYPTRMVLRPEEREAAHRLLEGHRLNFSKPIVALHPGSGGSAARWPLSSFMKLGDRLQQSGIQVVVTAGPGETYQNVMIDQMQRLPVMIPAGSVSLRELAAIFSCVNLVVSNSTGPLHLAVALGGRTVSIYSPLQACHPRRWGPFPASIEGQAEHAVALAKETREGEADMTSVSVDQVEELCARELRDERGPKASVL
jgi:ADP-heptose:LPS heptosyltransferase